MNISITLEFVTILFGSFLLVKLVKLFFQNQQGENVDSKWSKKWIALVIMYASLFVMLVGVYYGKVSSELSLILVLFIGLIKFVSPLLQKYWISRKIQVNDIFEFGGVYAKVIKVNNKDLVLSICNRGRFLLVPLAQVGRLNMVNLTQKKKPYKVHLSFNTSYKIDASTMEKTLLGIMNNDAKILTSPRSYVSIVNMGNWAIVFHLYFYTQDYYSIKNIKSEVKLKSMKCIRKEQSTRLFRKNDSLQRKKEYLSNN